MAEAKGEGMKKYIGLIIVLFLIIGCKSNLSTNQLKVLGNKICLPRQQDFDKIVFFYKDKNGNKFAFAEKGKVYGWSELKEEWLEIEIRVERIIK